MNRVAKIFRPDLASLGWALFLAINATSVWGGVFPFLPMDFQSSSILFAFFFAQANAFFVTFLVALLTSYRLPRAMRGHIIEAASASYAIGWLCLIGAMYLHGLQFALTVVGGVFIGIGAASFYLLWQRYFSSRQQKNGIQSLLVGTVYASLIYFGLYLIPRAVTVYLIPVVFLPLFALSLKIATRTIDFEQPMFQDVPRAHPRVYKHTIKDIWRSALSMGAVAFAAGVVRSLAISNPSLGSFVNLLSMAAMFVVASAMLVAWRLVNIRFNVIVIYRMLFPFIITILVLLPFMRASAYLYSASALLYALHATALVMMMIQCGQIAQEHGINPLFIYSFFGGIVYGLHDLGFILGRFSEVVKLAGFQPLTIAALVTVYFLALMFCIGSGTLRGTAHGLVSANTVEMPALVSHETEGAAKEPSPGPGEDRIAVQVHRLHDIYQLSPRETEVLELVARGNTVPSIAEKLFISENTVRTHTKHVYAKLGVHKKQELIDLVESLPGQDDPDTERT